MSEHIFPSDLFINDNSNQAKEQVERIVDQLHQAIENLTTNIEPKNIGYVMSIADGVVKVAQLSQAKYGEIVLINNLKAIVMELNTSFISAVMLETGEINQGALVYCTGSTLSLPVSDEVLGRVIDPFGNPLDDHKPIIVEKYMPLEADAPKVLDRKSIHQPCPSGTKIIDAFIPIGKGQREMIIGDRLTGKTSLAIDMIINQKHLIDQGERVVCIYVAIGQQASKISKVRNILKEQGALSYTTIVATTSADLASVQVQAPFAGCALGEFFRDKGQHAIVIYDDLTKHAIAYRELSLLLRRPPGREAYPGDIFYLHARLLERAAKLSDEKGGGSLTAIPILETQEGNYATYIPTNVWSITDGQIVLKNELFLSGQRPAIDIGLSVSRVGGAAQIPAIKAAIELKLLLAQYQEYKDFVKYGADIDQATQALINTGESLMIALKQKNMQPRTIVQQAVFLQACLKGKLNNLNETQITQFEKILYHLLSTDFIHVAQTIEQTTKIDLQTDREIDQLFEHVRMQLDGTAICEATN